VDDFADFFKDDPWSATNKTSYPYGHKLYLHDDRFWVTRNEKGNVLFFIHESGLIDINAIENLAGIEIEICQHNEVSTRLVCTLTSPEPSLQDKFSIVTKDVAYHCAKYNGAPLFIKVQERIKSWANFLKPTREGLSHSEFVGFWGELYTVSEILMKVHSPNNVVRFWIGPDGKKQDITLNNLALDVKTSMSGDPQNIKISSLEQLDKVTEHLYLLHLVAGPTSGSSGHSLSDMHAFCVRSLSSDLTAKTLFLQKTAKLYGKASKSQLEDKFTILSIDLYEVRDEFPSLTRADIPNSIVKLNYEISVAAIKEFQVEDDISEIFRNG